ncbi:hypothetical protein EV361DRAFT_874457 [Lentinula raphanica]|nr:hypothetical protein EV361DRAFT_874457 [Lentinula raphanica]
MSSKEDMQTVSHLAREIYTSVAAIHPPSPNASQETRETFNSMLRTAQQASGQILSLVIGMAQSTTDSNGQSLDLHLGNGHWDDLLLDEDPGLASSTDNDNDPPPDINDQIQADIEELLAEANDPELWFSLQDFRTMVEQGEHRGSTIQKEKEAFRRMLIGYRQVPLDDIVQAFDLHDLQLASVSIQRHTQHISTFHNLPLRDQRLFEREKLLYNPSSSHCVHAWINVVINNIEAIEFVKDWAGEAGEWRKDFRKTLATHFYASELSLIDRSLFPSTKKDKLRNRLYRRFAKKHDKVIVRRRHLHRFFELFGPTVLLDPTWLTLTKQGYPRQSKLWYDRVRSEVLDFGLQDEDIGRARYWNHRRFLLSVVECLGGRTVKAYVEDFLDQNLTWNPPPEPVDDDDNDD